MSDAATKELPEGWQLCKLGDVMRLKNGYAFKSKDYADSGIPLVRISDIKDGEVVIDKAVYIPDDLANEDFLVEPDDLLIAMSGATTGKTGVYKGVNPVLQNQRVGNFKIIDEATVNKRYRDYYISSLRKDIEKAAYGGAQPNISSKGIESFPFPLAPPEQQKRIVAKIEELFSHIDAGIEALKKAKQLLKQYRQSVLKAAVTGELTKEWREANSQSNSIELIEKIKQEKSELGKDPFYKRQKKVEKVDDEEKFAVIPNSWAWIRMADVCTKITDGAHNTPKILDKGAPYLTAKDITKGALDFSSNQYISEKEHKELFNKCRPEPGDILVVNIGASSGSAALIPEDIDFEFSFKNIAILKLSKNIYPPFIYWYLEYRKEIIFSERTRGGAQPFLSLAILNNLVVALPTKEEQIEMCTIVDGKIDSLKRLEREIDQQMKKSEVNKQSILASAFSGKIN